MRTSDPFSMTTPCNNCPFRTDVIPYLRAERVRKLSVSLKQETFDCHKTTNGEFSDDDGHYRKSGDEAHCAGALILMEKIDEPSQMMRIAERLGMYDPGELDMDAPVFDDWESMIQAQGN